LELIDLIVKEQVMQVLSNPVTRPGARFDTAEVHQPTFEIKTDTQLAARISNSFKSECRRPGGLSELELPF